jgi:ribosomal protein S3AE
MAERKRFNEVKIPLMHTESHILGNHDELVGKTIKLDLARQMRGKGLTITFKVFGHGKELVALPMRLELVKSFIRRVMRKRSDYVEDSFSAACLDVKTTVKPFLITRNKVSRAVRKNLRNTAKTFLLDYLKERDYNTVCQELRSGTLQKALLPKLKKVYPLSFCDLRIFETKEVSKLDIARVLEAAEKESGEELAQEVSVVEERPVQSDKANKDEEAK